MSYHRGFNYHSQCFGGVPFTSKYVGGTPSNKFQWSGFAFIMWNVRGQINHPPTDLREVTPLSSLLIRCRILINASATRSSVNKPSEWLCFIMSNSFVVDQRYRDSDRHRFDTHSMFIRSLSGRASKIRSRASFGRSSTVINGEKTESPSLVMTSFPISCCSCAALLLYDFSCSFVPSLIHWL